MLAESLTTQGVAWSRLGDYESSVNILRRAVSLAEEIGAHSHAGLAALTLIEEHGAMRLSEEELFGVYMRADELLGSTQDAEEVARLRGCARVVIKRVAGMSLRDRNFSLHGAVHDLEARLIGRALTDARGSVTRAARLLGVSHQLLTNMLNTRHTKLQQKRTPARKRLRSIIPKEIKK